MEFFRKFCWKRYYFPNRYYFSKTKEIFNKLKDRNLKNISMEILSMGMTNDYKIAIQEGATMIRVGSGIFGLREKQEDGKMSMFDKFKEIIGGSDYDEDFDDIEEVDKKIDEEVKEDFIQNPFYMNKIKVLTNIVDRYKIE